jgi:hypothetical protein
MKMSITAIPSPFDRATYSVLQYIDRGNQGGLREGTCQKRSMTAWSNSAAHQSGSYNLRRSLTGQATAYRAHGLQPRMLATRGYVLGSVWRRNELMHASV